MFNTKILVALARYDFVSKNMINSGIAKNIKFAYHYAKGIQKRFPQGEASIAKNGNTSYNYALVVLKGPFPLGEPIIALSPIWSYWYAKDVLKAPFPAGEAAIAKDRVFKEQYAKDVLKHESLE